jgi:hypothetical protein
VCGCLVGPHVLPHGLTGNHCRDFLLHDLSRLLEDVLPAFRARMLYMLDDASVHFSRVVQDVLNNTYHDGWIGRGHTECPPRLLYLNPLGTPRNLCVAAPVDIEEALHHPIVEAC